MFSIKFVPYLNVQEMHYNQHGMMILEGQVTHTHTQTHTQTHTHTHTHTHAHTYTHTYTHTTTSTG